jgi:hypothetical protein
LVFSVTREGKAEARLLVANKLTRGAGRDIQEVLMRLRPSIMREKENEEAGLGLKGRGD